MRHGIKTGWPDAYVLGRFFLKKKEVNEYTIEVIAKPPK